MANVKAPSLKKMLTEINDIGKKLSYSGIYTINMDRNELISSAQPDTNETFHVTIATLDEKYNEYLPYLRNAVDGILLSRVLKGTGVTIDVINDTTVSIKSMVKVKDTKVETFWTSNDFNQFKAVYNINKRLSKAQRAMRGMQNSDFHSEYTYNMNELRDNRKFLMDLSKILNVGVLRITNKMIHTLNASTILVKSSVTKPIINTVDQIKRMHIIETIEPQGIIRSYYPFIDK